MKAYQRTGGGTAGRNAADSLARVFLRLAGLLLAAVLYLILTGCSAAETAAGSAGSSEAAGEDPGVLLAGDGAAETAYRIALCAGTDEPEAEAVAESFRARLDEIGRERNAAFLVSFAGGADTGGNGGGLTGTDAVALALSRFPDSGADLLAGIGTDAAFAVKRAGADAAKKAGNSSAPRSSEQDSTDSGVPGSSEQDSQDTGTPGSSEQDSQNTGTPGSSEQDSQNTGTPGSSEQDSLDTGTPGSSEQDSGAENAPKDTNARRGLYVLFAAVPDLAGLTDGTDDVMPGVAAPWDAEGLAGLLMALEPEVHKVGLLYNAEDAASAAAVSDAVALFQTHGVELVERTGSTADELQIAAQALASDGPEAVYTPRDAAVLAAEGIVGGILAEAGIPHYAGSAASAEAGAFLGYGADPAVLGREAADMAASILLDREPGFVAVVQPSAAVNAGTLAALGRDGDAVLAALEPLVPVRTVSVP